MPYVYNQQYVPYTYQQPLNQLDQLRAGQMLQPQQAQTQTQSPIIWVQGIEAAKAYMVAPGASVLLMDAEAQTFYIKAADASGMPQPLRIFEYHEITPGVTAPGTNEQQKPAIECEYVTTADMISLRQEMQELISKNAKTQKQEIQILNQKMQDLISKNAKKGDILDEQHIPDDE